MAISLGQSPIINAEAEAKRHIEFEVDDPKAFSKSIGVIKKLIDEACFEARDNEGVVLQQMDPSHVALARFKIGAADMREFRTGSRFCVSVEKLTKVLGRMRRDDETVKLSVRDDKVVVKFPTTEREFMVERIDMEPEELPEPKINFTAKARVATKELNAVLRDVAEADIVKLRAEDGVVLSAEFDERGYSKRFKPGGYDLMGYEASAPSPASYPQKYLEDIATAEFDIATLRWAKDMPLELSYDPMPHSRLEFLLAPRVESD